MGLANLQMQDMTSNSGISIHNIEPELSYIEGLCPSKTKPEYWNRLGSSKSRTTDQQVEARTTVQTLVQECNVNAIIAFTDGSCKGNPGPCGSGACIYLPNVDQPVCLKKPVTNRGSILLGELVAIHIALEFTLNEIKKRQVSGITIFSDSQSAIGILTLGWTATSHKHSVRDIKMSMIELQQNNINVDIKWTPGHADIKGNNIADELAKEAALEAEKFPEDSQEITAGDFKNLARVSCGMKWQRRWDASETGRHLYDFRPQVSLSLPDYMFMSYITEKKVISQLRTGFSSLNYYKHKVGLQESPNCICGETETVDHFICNCELYELQRQKLSVRAKNFFSY